MKKIKFTGVEDKEVQQKILQYHAEFWAKVETWIIKPRCRKTVTVHLNTKHRSYAGYATYRTVHISLNYWMLYKDDVELRETYGHELAHLLARYIHHKKTISPHGAEWKFVMTQLGLKPKRCHDVDLKERKQRRASWKADSRSKEMVESV